MIRVGASQSAIALSAMLCLPYSLKSIQNKGYSLVGWVIGTQPNASGVNTSPINVILT